MNFQYSANKIHDLHPLENSFKNVRLNGIVSKSIFKFRSSWYFCTQGGGRGALYLTINSRTPVGGFILGGWGGALYTREEVYAASVRVWVSLSLLQGRRNNTHQMLPIILPKCEKAPGGPRNGIHNKQELGVGEGRGGRGDSASATTCSRRAAPWSGPPLPLWSAWATRGGLQAFCRQRTCLYHILSLQTMSGPRLAPRGTLLEWRR